MSRNKTELNVIEDCNGCGVCCLHMGYPAYMLPREPVAADQIAVDPELQQLLKAGWTEAELLKGHPGEKYWHQLPGKLKEEWQAFVDSYRREGELDGPCFWFDQETRLCKHHQVRPQVCRDFEAGSVECRQWRKVYEDKVIKN